MIQVNDKYYVIVHIEVNRMMKMARVQVEEYTDHVKAIEMDGGTPYKHSMGVVLQGKKYFPEQDGADMVADAYAKLLLKEFPDGVII
jgi:hypothetical protein